MSHVVNPVAEAGELRCSVLSSRGVWKDIQLSGYELWELVRTGRARGHDESYFRDHGVFNELVCDNAIRESGKIRYISHANSYSASEDVYDAMPNGFAVPDSTGNVFIPGTLLPSRVLEFKTPEEKTEAIDVAISLLEAAGFDPDILPYFYMTETVNSKRKLAVLRSYNPEQRGKFDVNIFYTTLRIPEFVYRPKS